MSGKISFGSPFSKSPPPGKECDTVYSQNSYIQMLKTCVNDKSWRVRYMLADQISAICDCFGEAFVEQVFLEILADQEAEVRAVAVTKLPDAARIAGDKRKFLEMLQPKLANLGTDCFASVRIALAGSVLNLAPIVGEALTVDFLIKVCLELIRDESSEVRLKLIGTLSELSQVVGSSIENLPPHVYTIAAGALAGLRETGQEQAVLISGESGAGKFESGQQRINN